MKNNYTVMFLFLFIASVAGGLALKNIYDYSMIIGAGLGTIFLLCSAFFVGRRLNNTKTQ